VEECRLLLAQTSSPAVCRELAQTIRELVAAAQDIRAAMEE
jgi:hypothetical protein